MLEPKSPTGEVSSVLNFWAVWPQHNQFCRLKMQQLRSPDNYISLQQQIWAVNIYGCFILALTPHRFTSPHLFGEKPLYDSHESVFWMGNLKERNLWDELKPQSLHLILSVTGTHPFSPMQSIPNLSCPQLLSQHISGIVTQIFVPKGLNVWWSYFSQAWVAASICPMRQESSRRCLSWLHGFHMCSPLAPLCKKQSYFLLPPRVNYPC